jgi:hypothetical protein
MINPSQRRIRSNNQQSLVLGLLWYESLISHLEIFNAQQYLTSKKILSGTRNFNFLEADVNQDS